MATPFFDPLMAYTLRQQGLQLSRGVADARLEQSRLEEDANLMRPFMQRRFDQQLSQTAEGIAGRGFHGTRSGPMRSGLADVAEEQAFREGQFERELARGHEDIERGIVRMEEDAAITGSEAVREGAGRRSQQEMSRLPF